MYYPYLRARQFELIALRELASEGATSHVIPVLEPLSNRFNNLVLANTVFHEKSFKPFLIVNPFEGDISGDTEFFLDFLVELPDLSFRVAFHYNDNKEYIEASILKYQLTDCLSLSANF